MMAAADVLEFHDINSEIKGALCQGRLKLTEQSIIFKNSKTGKVDQLAAADVELASWLKLVGQFGIRLFLKNGSLYRFIGFKEGEREKLAKFFRNAYDLDFLEKELSVRGWNWGTAKFIGSVLSFEVNNVTAFEVPLNNVSQCTTGKNEITVEFHKNDDAPVSLTEMRFHIPSSELAGDDPVEAFHSQVMKQASVISVSGDAIAIFREIHILTPRGRYDIKIFPTFFQLHGKTFDYKVPMSTVIRLFLLPHKDNRQHFLVISLDPPIKQGQTRYHYLVLQFNQDDDISMELPFTEEEIKTKYEGKISKELSGPTYEVLGKIMKVLVNRKITTPGSFVGHSGTAAISCSYKAAAGYIYPLDKGFIYIHKPPIHIRFEEISCVNFARGGGTNRSFDFEIELKNGTVNTFSNIEKEEYGKLYDFINEKKLRVKNRGKTDSAHIADDFGDSDDENGNDAYLNRVKQEGAEKDDDDEDESTDEDFKPPADDVSEVEDEYDSNPQTTDSESGGSDGDQKKEKSKPKKEKKEKPKKSKSESDKPRKKKRKEKDANKPKRPPSAYFLWFTESREKIKSDNPGISFTDIAKKGGELWKKLGSKEKEVYEQKANVAKEEYQAAMKEYKASGGGENKDKKSSDSKDKKTKSKSKASVASTTKQGSGSHYVSKEFIEDDSSSSSDDSDKSTKKESKPTESKKPATPVKKEATSEASSDDDSAASDKDSDNSDKGTSSKPQAKRKKAESSGDEKKSSAKKKAAKDDSSEDEVDDDSEDDRKAAKRKKNESSSEDEDKKRTSKKKKDDSESSEEEEDESGESTPASDDDD